MSDDESISESISEESIAYHSDDNSEVYNPNESQDNFDNDKSTDKFKKLPGVKSLSNTSLSIVNYDKDDDDYVFDDFEDSESIVSQAYSNDFESAIDISKSSIPSPRSGKPSPRNRNYQNSTEKIYKDLSLKSLENKNNIGISNLIKQPPFQSSPKRSKSNQQHTAQSNLNLNNKNNYNPYNMPSLQVQTVQAELALDEISKEVLRLRNQQRTMLKERKQNAKDSKQRAEDRRLQYNEEMKNLKKIAQESTLTVTNLQEKIDGLEKQILIEQNTKEYFKKTITSLEENINVLEEKNENSLQEIDEYKTEIITIKKELKNAEKEWLGDKKNLEKSCQRAELLISVMQKSTEDNEARIQRDRESLPQHHQRILNDHQLRLSNQERALQQREHSIKEEEARQLKNIEQLRIQSLDEFQVKRNRIEEDLIFQRNELYTMKSNFEREKTSWNFQRAEELANIEKLRIEINQQQRNLIVEQSNFDKIKIEFEIGQRMIEPNIRAAENERSEARAIKSQADSILLAAEEHASSVLASERGLIRREQAAIELEHKNMILKEKIETDRKEIQLERKKIQLDHQKLKTEKFRLHQSSIEMSRQADELRHTCGLISILEPEERRLIHDKENNYYNEKPTTNNSERQYKLPTSGYNKISENSVDILTRNIIKSQMNESSSSTVISESFSFDEFNSNSNKSSNALVTINVEEFEDRYLRSPKLKTSSPSNNYENNYSSYLPPKPPLFSDNEHTNEWITVKSKSSLVERDYNITRNDNLRSSMDDVSQANDVLKSIANKFGVHLP